ncbi:MAG: hypothetical protein R3C61_28215 [Bacteroidia bacterium]
MKKLLLILIVCMGYLQGKSQDTVKTIHFDGYKTKVEWANKSSRMACLVHFNENSILYIIDAGRAGIMREIRLPEGLYVTTFTWTGDDKGIILTSWNQEEMEAGSFYLNVAKGGITDTLPHLGAYYQVDDMDGFEDYLVVASSGEGHPDITVYRGEDYKEIVQTEVYPGGINLDGFCKGKLYITSDVRLEWGLTREDRLAYMKKAGLVENEENVDLFEYLTEDWRVFTVDLKTNKVKEASFPPGCDKYSVDGQYSFTSSIDDEGLLAFELTLLKHR